METKDQTNFITLDQQSCLVETMPLKAFLFLVIVVFCAAEPNGLSTYLRGLSKEQSWLKWSDAI